MTIITQDQDQDQDHVLTLLAYALTEFESISKPKDPQLIYWLKKTCKHN